VGNSRGVTGDWDRVAREQYRSGRRGGLIDEHGRDTYLSLVERWADLANGSRVLKTDLFDVAFASRPFLFDLARSGISVVGIDVSGEVVANAKRRAEQHGFDAGCYLRCDVRGIPLREGSIDLIVSDSTLDHFATEMDIVAALRELRRVLRPGGVLILTIDNESNLTYPPYTIMRLWMRLGLAPYFIGKTLSPAKLRRTLEDLGFAVVESTAIFHCPHPDALVRWFETSLRWLSRGKLDGAIRRALLLLEKLGSMRTRYLTGRYIAVKAVKRDPGRDSGRAL
jgi:ubiquinone/menaquinone biosynthesis C-methylase UbiE